MALHNMCEIHHDSFKEEWLQEVDLDHPEHHASAESPGGHGRFEKYLWNILIKTSDNN